MQLDQAIQIPRRLQENVAKVIIGKDRQIALVIAALLAKGHVLLEDVPGTGKTMLARSLAASMGGVFHRVQFTPDILPSDVTGMSVYNQKDQVFEFKPGPIFAQVVLADEINRATPRSQSSLLECMEERQVTNDGVTRPLPEPFFVIATQNPVEIQGTFPLPEAQLDRFLVQLGLGYPNPEETLSMMDRFIQDSPVESLQPVTTPEELAQAQAFVRTIHVSQPVRAYMAALVEATRTHERVALGVSPRGALALMKGCQAYALVQGRDYVLPDDVKAMASAVLAHRMMIKNALGSSRQAAQAVLEELLAQVPVPDEDTAAKRG
ncbi:MAG: AAA family ATPase [Christensenellales bacterium]